MKIRLKQYKQGWIAEYADPSWTLFGISFKWKPITTYAGLDKPYFYKTPEEARDYAAVEFKKELNFSFHFSNMDKFK